MQGDLKTQLSLYTFLCSAVNRSFSYTTLKRALLAGPVVFFIIFVFINSSVLFASQRGIRFLNTAAESGIKAQIQCGSSEKRWIMEANGSGSVWLDYDNDGWLDLLIVNGSDVEALRKNVSGARPAARKEGIYLYKNLRNNRFQDVTAEANLVNPYWGTGANAIDFNNDGYADILVTTIGVDLLYKNNGDGTFSEVSKAAGLSQRVAWHTGSAFGDYDNDGDLDLYIAGYVDIKSLLQKASSPPSCLYRGVPGFCGPKGLDGEQDVLYRNNGDGTFTDVTEQAKVVDRGAYHGFTVVFDDFNQDGRADIFVANDSDPNYLYLNLGNSTFKEAGLTSGVAVSEDGRTQANMGVAVGDYDNDGMVDILTTTFSEDYNPLFKQQQLGLFEDVSSKIGLKTATLPWVGWACGFADFDNDGDKDLWVANGHVYPKIDQLPSTTYFQPFAVFENREAKLFLASNVLPNAPKNSYRGGSDGDFDNDGKVDVVVLPISGSPLLLSNRTATSHSWIGFRLRGKRSNRSGIGARLRIEGCGKIQGDTMRNGGSYISQNDPRIHFGLGSCSRVDRVTVNWPSGVVQVIKDLNANQYLTIEEQ